MGDTPNEKFSMLDPRKQTERDREYARRMEIYYRKSLGSNMDKLRHFAKFVPLQTLSKFLAKCELFQHVLEVHGHIIECGVLLGGGLMAWAQLSAIYEPVNHIRRIVGFDTFTGFPELTKKDEGGNVDHAVPGGLATHACDDLMECIELYDMNRPLGHIPRVEVVVGDAMQTIPEYVRKNPHVVVAMLYLDFDLFEPTKLAIEAFFPRMPRGAVLVFDELNQSAWPGETLAAMETVGLRSLRIRRFTFTPQLSYAVLE